MLKEEIENRFIDFASALAMEITAVEFYEKFGISVTEIDDRVLVYKEREKEFEEMNKNNVNYVIETIANIFKKEESWIKK